MAVYAIGDIQGCFDELMTLLAQIHFEPGHDHLWFVGDLVNRGPQSLQVLRYVRNLGESAVTVLGNHDLHLLAVAGGHTAARRDDTFHDVLNAPDRDALLHWLRHQPLLHHDSKLGDHGRGITMIHAGLPPQWDLATARARAAEAENALRGAHYHDYLAAIYGNGPAQWSGTLSGSERWRFITNCFTRLRYCDAQGRLALKDKGAPGTQTAGYLPWFTVPGRASAGLEIVFGHWSTLDPATAACAEHHVHHLDTGCVWGGALTALRLDDSTREVRPGKQRERISIPCPGACAPGDTIARVPGTRSWTAT